MKYKEKSLKCGYRNCNCHNLIEVNDYTINKIVHFGKNYYHRECFINWCNECRKNSTNHKDKYRERLEHIADYRKEAYNRLVVKGSEKDENKLTLKDFYKFIRQNYNLRSIPKSISIRLNEVFSGKYSRCPIDGIPKEDFMDMWQKKKIELIQTREKATMRGLQMNEEQKVLYDISVLVSKYDGYCKWKEESERNYINNFSHQEDPTIITTRNFLRYYKPPKKEKKDEINILEMINETLGYDDEP